MPARKPPPQSFTVSRAGLTWFVGIVGGLIVAYIGAMQIWDSIWTRVDARWRLEAVQKAKDEKVDAQIKGVAEKADADLKAAVAEIKTDISKYKEEDRRSGAWTSYMLQDFRAAAEAKWAQDCADRKRPADVCKELELKADEARKRANEQRALAMDASKGKP